MLNRRSCIGLAASALSAVSGLASGQAPGRVYRVGILRLSVRPLAATDVQFSGIPKALAELGYAQGRNLVIEQRFAEGDAQRLPALARELVDAKVDVIVAVAAPAVRAARAATATLPIVMFGNFDPVALGLVASLARSGGNITGILIAPDGTLGGKRLELLTLLVPKIKRVGFLLPPDEASVRMQLEETRKAAAILGVELNPVEVRNWEYEPAFKAIAAQRSGALLVATTTQFLRDRRTIIDLAAKHRLPAMYEWREHVVDGGLMAYGTDIYGLYQRLASSIDRIFKGAQPADLPVEQPTRFSLSINKTTAKALRLTIPPSFMLRVDEAIE